MKYLVKPITKNIDSYCYCGEQCESKCGSDCTGKCNSVAPCPNKIYYV